MLHRVHMENVVYIVYPYTKERQQQYGHSDHNITLMVLRTKKSSSPLHITLIHLLCTYLHNVYCFIISINLLIYRFI